VFRNPAGRLRFLARPVVAMLIESDGERIQSTNFSKLAAIARASRAVRR
jgi:hypothetical protein